ncbi:MAG: hypothetical protein IE933_09595 [Sphingomonadales bacterium]|nr:hypothetical protein [Sphingomonadales bacterium]MBD3775169.1 hypothetical protein [Paracoccaceae bacterium]
MSDRFIDFGNGFHSIRGSHKLGGLVDVGTHCSLVELASGDYVFLDSYTLDDAIRAQVDRVTDGGAKVRAIINLHPFHTVHCAWMHRAFPEARLYGTVRHHQYLDGLPWQPEPVESEFFPPLFAGQIEFSVPAGIDLVCADQNVHFGSVLAYHPPSQTIHVDDTLSRIEAPFPLSLAPMAGRLDFHPTLGKALRQQAGAADAFREWAVDLALRWHEAGRIVTAHNSALDLWGEHLPEVMGEALGRAKPVLDRHRAKFG